MICLLSTFYLALCGRIAANSLLGEPFVHPFVQTYLYWPNFRASSGSTPLYRHFPFSAINTSLALPTSCGGDSLTMRGMQKLLICLNVLVLLKCHGLLDALLQTLDAL
jgi:hypothetical protein